MSLVCLTVLGSFIGLGIISPDIIKIPLYSAGKFFSQKFSIVPGWNNTIEPLIVKSATVTVMGLDSFLHGMASDNNGELDDDLDLFHESLGKLE